jgi:RNA-directed DNA polymerase
MDSQLLELAIQNRCVYTRYADDLTFSTTIRSFPGSLATILPSGKVELGSDLLEIIISNDFQVNTSKTRLQTEHRRQEVTGLIVNEFPNIKREFILQVRAMLHDWRVNGIETAQRNHFNKWRTKDTPPFKDDPSLKNIVKGKIDFLGMVRGKEDPIYLKYLYEYAKLNPEFPFPYLFPQQPETTKAQVMIFTEGKTDCIHLKAAHRYFQSQGKFSNLVIHFKDDEEDFGDTKLLKFCDSYSKSPVEHNFPAIMLFDNDKPQTLKDANILDNPFHFWGRNVYSVKLPVPPHREHSPDICIEFLYTDEEIKRVDNEGYRLYISSEFIPESGRHHSEDLVYTNQKRLAKSPHDFIIDDGVFDDSSKDVALPKSKFANYVFNQTSNYDNFDFSPFESLFDLFSKISLSNN